MASDWVVDSSVVAKWFLPEPDTALAQRVAADVRAQGHQLIVLDLALIEVANAIRVQHHRRQLPRADAELFFDDLMHAMLDVRPARPLLPAAFALATRYDFGRL